MRNSPAATAARGDVANREAAPVKWGAAYSGALMAVALFGVFSVLWLALAYSGSGSQYFQSNLDWYLGGTALVAWFIGGMMTGRVIGASAASSAAAMWALTIVGALIVVVPMEFSYLQAGPGTRALRNLSQYTLWITFGSAILGLLTAWIGAAMVAAPLRRARRGEPEPVPSNYPDARYAPPAPRSGGQPTAVVGERPL
jgi:hypothetical protein